MSSIDDIKAALQTLTETVNAFVAPAPSTPTEVDLSPGQTITVKSV